MSNDTKEAVTLETLLALPGVKIEKFDGEYEIETDRDTNEVRVEGQKQAGVALLLDNEDIIFNYTVDDDIDNMCAPTVGTFRDLGLLALLDPDREWSDERTVGRADLHPVLRDHLYDLARAAGEEQEEAIAVAKAEALMDTDSAHYIAYYPRGFDNECELFAVADAADLDDAKQWVRDVRDAKGADSSRWETVTVERATELLADSYRDHANYEMIVDYVGGWGEQWEQRGMRGY